MLQWYRMGRSFGGRWVPFGNARRRSPCGCCCRPERPLGLAPAPAGGGLDNARCRRGLRRGRGCVAVARTTAEMAVTNGLTAVVLLGAAGVALWRLPALHPAQLWLLPWAVSAALGASRLLPLPRAFVGNRRSGVRRKRGCSSLPYLLVNVSGASNETPGEATSGVQAAAVVVSGLDHSGADAVPPRCRKPIRDPCGAGLVAGGSSRDRERRSRADRQVPLPGICGCCPMRRVRRARGLGGRESGDGGSPWASSW